MIDFSLTEEQLDVQKIARDFAQKIKPLGIEADRIPDPKDVFPRISEVVREGIELGFNTMVIPREYGGRGLDHRTMGIASEELAAGDVGIAGVLGISNIAWLPLILGGTEEQKKEWLGKVCSSDPGDLFIGCWAATEPQGLSVDIDALLEGKLAGITLKTVARPEGKDYIINGQKCFITSGGIAKLCLLLANTPEGPAHFIVPTDNPGFSVGKIEDMMGHRCMNDAELFFDNMRIPKENMVGGQAGGFIELARAVGYSDAWVGALAVGLGRAAYEAALEYSKIRVLGKPIIMFQAVAMMIADMFLELEAARSLVWKSLWVNDTQDAPDSKLAAAAKVLASDTAMKVATNAVQVYGGAGYMKENPVEKYMRDAKVSQIYEGTNELLRIMISMLLGFGM